MSKSRPPGKLIQRLLTALLLLPLVVGAVVYLPTVWLGVVIGIFILIAAWEWALLSGLYRRGQRLLYVIVLGVGGAAGYWMILYSPVNAVIIAGAGVLWWTWSFIDLLRGSEGRHGIYGHLPGRLLGGVSVLLPAWVVTIYLHLADPDSPSIVLYLFTLVWVADSSAYFAGRRWGRTKLAPHISPGKTVEGLCGAIATVILLAYVCGTMIWELSPRELLAWMLVTLFTMLFSVVGDLAESKLKRRANVKDSGGWLPGHGGALDRIDALTAGAPAFALGWAWFLDGNGWTN